MRLPDNRCWQGLPSVVAHGQSTNLLSCFEFALPCTIQYPQNTIDHACGIDIYGNSHIRLLLRTVPVVKDGGSMCQLSLGFDVAMQHSCGKQLGVKGSNDRHNVMNINLFQSMVRVIMLEIGFM